MQGNFRKVDITGSFRDEISKIARSSHSIAVLNDKVSVDRLKFLAKAAYPDPPACYRSTYSVVSTNREFRSTLKCTFMI